MDSRHFGKCSVSFDDRYAPIYVTAWMGQTSLEAAKWGLELQGGGAREQLRRGGRMIAISDATHVERPTPEVRKYFAEHAEELARTTHGVLLSSYVVTANPLVRGVITAVGWMSETARGVKGVATMREAIERALRDLENAGIPRPSGLDPLSYQLPALAKIG